MTPEQQNIATGVGQGAAIVGSLADSLGPADTYGKKSLSSNILGNAGKYASAGATFGPWGAAAGAAVGIAKGIFDNGQQQKAADAARYQEQVQQSRTNQAQLAARYNANPNLLRGNTNSTYYANGGPLATKYLGQQNVANQETQGGDANPISSTASEFDGPSHEDGGIQIPGQQAEVEGNESSENGYVFSDRLGFAAPHKKLARAIGKIEQKTMSPERITSLKLLRGEINNLRQQQEQVKQQLNLQ